MARFDVVEPVTRAELEATLRREGFAQQDGGSVWWSQDRTKFVAFPDDDSGEAIYGDSEIGEPGKTIPIAVAGRVVRGELLLDSPLGVMPAQQREPAVLAAPRSARGLTADDPLPELPSHADMGKADWFVRPLSPGRHDTIRPPPSVPPKALSLAPVRALPFVATQEQKQFHRLLPILRWVTIAASVAFFVTCIFVPPGDAQKWILLSSLIVVAVMFVPIAVLTVRALKK